MTFIKHYQHDPALRRSFNALAEKTFGLNFEDWYALGYWGDNYTPYSIVEGGEIVANVSVNRTNFLVNGVQKTVYQLGTVMTAEGFRHRGLIRRIMAEVETDTAGADGIYLFANDSVVDFYPKFGFVPAQEYAYSKALSQSGENRWESVSMADPGSRAALLAAMEESTFREGCRMISNPGLIFFYAAQFLADCVYRLGDIWVIAEREEGNLLLHNVFAPRETDLDELLAAFGSEVTRAELGFTPADPRGWEVREIQEEDSHFFVKGDFFRDFQREKLRIPTLSHA